jgi:FkbM family methyltransferase
MIFKKALLATYKIFSSFYVFIFGRKKMQFFNDIVLSLALNAKGYKNYGSFKKTGEKNFINKINNDLFLCIDIGANVGKYTKLLLTETKSKIISFEPLPLAFKDLQKIEQNNSERLKVYNYAIGEKDETLELNYSNEKSEKASFLENLNELSFYDFKNNQKIKTKVYCLDTFFSNNPNLLSKNIDLVKIDTEGFEFEVLKGAKKMLEQNPPKYIQIEFNWHQLFKAQTIYNFSKFLHQYDLYQILPHGNDLIKINPSRPESNIFHLTNFVYIRKDISKF